MSLLAHIVDVRWQPVRRMVTNESPFTGRRQRSTLRFHRWEFSVQYAKTMGANAAAKRAALAALAGGVGYFDFRDPSYASPTSGYSGSGAINGDSTGYTVTADGFTPGALLLKAGDFFSVQISSRWQLFMAAADVTANGSGEASITTTTPIRGTAPDGATVKISDWLVSVTIDGDESYNVDKNGVLVLPPLKFVEAY